MVLICRYAAAQSVGPQTQPGSLAGEKGGGGDRLQHCTAGLLNRAGEGGGGGGGGGGKRGYLPRAPRYNRGPAVQNCIV